jgi:glycerophosphoryl diester phosphodiesterase
VNSPISGFKFPTGIPPRQSLDTGSVPEGNRVIKSYPATSTNFNSPNLAKTSTNETLIAQSNNPTGVGNKDFSRGEIQGIGPDGRVYRTQLIERIYDGGGNPTRFYANEKLLPSEINTVEKAKIFVRQGISNGTMGRLNLGNQLAFPIPKMSVLPAYTPKVKEGDNAGSIRFETLSAGRQVVVGARKDGSLFMDVPKQVYPKAEGRRVTIPGATSNSTPQQISQAIKRLTNNPALIPYVYNSSRKAIYNTGGPERSTRPNFELQGEQSKGMRKTWAHAGSREDMPGMPNAKEKIKNMATPSFHEAGWENSMEALTAAADKGAGLEIDYRMGVNGEGYLYHDHQGQRINKFGKAYGSNVNIAYGKREDVQQVATPLSKVLAKFNRIDYPNSSFIIEMKKDTPTFPPLPMTAGYAKKAAAALYSELKMHDRHKDVIVSSMEPEMLSEISKLAKADGVTMNLMYVLGAFDTMGKGKVDYIKQSLPDVKRIGFITDTVGKSEETWAKDVAYAKSQGFITVGWNWDSSPGTVGVQDSTDKANKIDVDEMITDGITNLRNSNKTLRPDQRKWN